MTQVRFVKNRGFERDIQNDPEFAVAMRRYPVEVAVAVKEAAQPFRHTGYYIRHIRVEGPYVIAGDPFAHLIEWGSKNNAAYAPLRRGVRAAGLRLDDARK